VEEVGFPEAFCLFISDVTVHHDLKSSSALFCETGKSHLTLILNDFVGFWDMKSISLSDGQQSFKTQLAARSSALKAMHITVTLY